MRGFRFLGRLCIDLAVTGGEGRYARFETLHEPADLDRWFAASPLAVAPAPPGSPDLAAAKRLRRAIWNAAEAIVEGLPVAAADVAEINAAAAAPPLVRRLAGASGSSASCDLRWVWDAPQATAALSDIARDAIALLADPAQRARLRRCASPDCALIFYDGSRPGRRRWCSTERCGDRMRARAYRARHRA